MVFSIDYSVIVPLYNEEEVILECWKRLSEVMEKSGGIYEIIFVNDGSRDTTMDIVRDMAKKDKHIKAVGFSRNFGHQTAITAGMDMADGKAVVVIDADLQDPPHIIIEMIAKWKEGYDVVYGKRTKRRGETLFKKITAMAFYRMLNSLTDTQMPVDTGDFRLIDRKVVDALKALPEHNRYVRGLVSWVGFNQTALEYVRDERFAGKTKYSVRKMLRFASDGLTSFSYKPLKLSITIGVIVSLCSLAYIAYALLTAVFTSSMLDGGTCLAFVLLFFNGVMLITLGIIGQYIGRIYDETKARPLYIIEETIGFAKKQSSETNID